MKITFILPAYAQTPVGGFRVAYEYANRLQQHGHKVTVIHPRWIQPPLKLKDRLVGFVWPYRWRLKHRPLVPWFPARHNTRYRLTSDLGSTHIPDGDIIFATGWQTAEMIKDYPASKGRKFYLVYDYEIWRSTDEATRLRIGETHRAGLKLIATSPAVLEMLQANKAPDLIEYIPGGIDFEVFNLQTPISARSPGVIGFPLRPAPEKGASDALKALGLVRANFARSHPEAHLKFKAFGPPTQLELPDWLEFCQSPSDHQLARFYNSLSIFLHPSHYEGWGLPGIEAMACGAALVTYNNGGNRDYARPEQTACVVDSKQPDLLAKAIELLLQNDQKRMELAQNGHYFVQQYTWAKAVEQLENLITQAN